MTTSADAVPGGGERDLILGFTRGVGTPGMVVLSKIAPPSTTFAQTDLAGPWRVYMQRVEAKLSGGTWQVGRTVFTTGGAFSSADLQDVNDVGTALTTGSLTVGADGSVSGTLASGTGATAQRYEIRGTMRAAKDLVTGVVTATLPSGTHQGIVTMVRELAVLDIAQPAYAVLEGNQATITVLRSGNPARQVTVSYAATGGTAPAGDYVLIPGTLTFLPGQTSRTFTVQTKDDQAAQGPRTVTLTLSGPGGEDVVLGATTSSPLTIQDNDASTIQLALSTLSVPETGNATLMVTRTGGKGPGVVVTFRTVDGTARAGVDYEARNGSVTFGLSQVSLPITVPIEPNQIVDGDRTFTVELLSVTPGHTLGTPASALVTIKNDDLGGTVKFVVAAASVTEGASAPLMLTRAGGTGGNVSVRWSTVDGTAKANLDYEPVVSGIVTFEAGELTKPISVVTKPDALVEGDETLRVMLSTPVGLTLGAPSAATITILDAQQGLQFSAPAYTVTEGTPTATITVVRTGPAGGVVTVRYSTSPGGATAGADYTSVNGVLTFANLQRTATFTVPIANDAMAETAETVLLVLSDPSAPAGLGPQSTATLTVGDNDAAGVVRLGGAGFAVSEGAGVVLVPVQRVGNAAGIMVDYATTPGTATAGADYLTTRGRLTFAANETAKTIPVTILADNRDEPNETFTLTLGNVSAPASLGVPFSAVITITDDDVPGTIAFGTAAFTVKETDAFAVVTVTRTGGLAGGVTVDFATADGSATANSDYTPRSTTLTFNGGETTKRVTVPILPDILREGNETVMLTLANPGGGAVLGAIKTAVLTIMDDETGPTVQFGAASFSVSESATTASIVVTRTGSTAAGQTVLVRTTTAGSAPPPQFTPISDQLLTFAANQTSLTVTVTLNAANTSMDGDRTVALELASPLSPLNLGAPRTALLVIRDDDSALQLTTTTVSVVEGAPALLTVQRTGATQAPATVRYTTTNGTAVAPGDYTPATSALVSFGPGVASQTISILTANDTLAEGNESFTVTLSQPTGAVLGPNTQATVTIQDNDGAGIVQLGAAAYSVVEGGMAAITLTRTGGLGVTTVGFATGPGGTATGATVAGSGVDYLTRTGVLTFAAGATSLTVMVPTLQDTAVEGAETVSLSLTVLPGSLVSLGPQVTGTLTIFDDEQARFQFSAAAYAVAEAAGLAMLTVQRVGPTTGDHTVGYTLSGMTATAGNDFNGAGGTLSFPPGVTSRPLLVPITPDLLSEGTEGFGVTLVSPSGTSALGFPSSTVVTVTDDDAAGAVQFTAASVSVVEGEPVVVTVTRTGAAGPAAVAWATGGGTATPGADYTAASGALTFAPGEMSKTLPPITTVADAVVEGSEFFQVTLSSLTGNLALGAATTLNVWLLDLAQTLQFTTATAAVVEGGQATITVTRAGVPTGQATVTLTRGGSAQPGTDYTDPGAIVLTFPAGVTTQSFTIQTTGDAILEPAGETITFTLATPTGAALGAPATLTLTIVDNERPDLVVTAVTAPAQAASGLKMPVTVTVQNRSGAAALASKLGIYLSAGVATPGAGTRIAVLDVPALAAGASTIVSGPVSLPLDTAAGAYFVSAVADTLGALLEEIEANNGLTAPLTVDVVTLLPDLVVTSVSIPGDTRSGKVVSAPATVVNGGPVASGPYRVGVFLSKDDPTPGAGLLLGVKDMPALPAGGTAAVPLSLTIPEDLSQGSYFVSAVADVNQVLPDANRANNALVSDVSFRVNRDLGKFKTFAASISAPSTCLFPDLTPIPVQLTLNVTGLINVTSQTSNTAQGSADLNGEIFVQGFGKVADARLTGPFSASVNDSDIATITIDFTIFVQPTPAFALIPPFTTTGSFTASGGPIDRGLLRATITSGTLGSSCGGITGSVEIRGVQSYFFSLLYFALGGEFAGQTTPVLQTPLAIGGYSAGVVVLFDPTPASLGQVRFTGPPVLPLGARIVNEPADIRQDFAAGNFYETDIFPAPTTSPKGTWIVSYEGVSRSFAVAEPEAEQRFVAMLPTVILNPAQTHITEIRWVFKDRITGATVPAPPHADAQQIELDGFGVHVYTSPNFPRGIQTTGVLATPIPVSQVQTMYISYKDTLTGNFYVTVYTQ